MVPNGNWVAIAAGAVFASAVLLIARGVTTPWTRSDVLVMVALAIVVRYATAGLLHDGLTSMGGDGFVTGDDRTYADLSWRLVRLWRGEIVDFNYGSESYLLGTYVYLETAVFALVGPNVLVVKLLNGALGGALVALIYGLTRQIFVAHRPALTASMVVALYPSLVLWSALNLKDSLALILIASVLWLLALFAARRTVWLIPLMYAAVVLMQDLREYIFVGLALVIPVGVVLASRAMRNWGGIGSATSIALSAALLIAYATEGTAFSTSTLATLELVRGAMGMGARTRITDVPVVQVQEGQTYVVPGTVAHSAASNTVTAADPTQRVIVVTPGAQIVVASPQAVPVGSYTGPVAVAPGDVVVVGGPAATAAPASERKELPIGAQSGRVELGSTSEGALALRTIRYLPIGLAFVLLAPFPWSIQRTLDLLPMPEMLLWYICLVAASVTLIRERRRWRALAPVGLFIVGTLAVLALAEGNVGTLYRHRAMVIPFVIVAASPGLMRLLERIPTLWMQLTRRREQRAQLGSAVGR